MTRYRSSASPCSLPRSRQHYNNHLLIFAPASLCPWIASLELLRAECAERMQKGGIWWCKKYIHPSSFDLLSCQTLWCICHPRKHAERNGCLESTKCGKFQLAQAKETKIQVCAAHLAHMSAFVFNPKRFLWTHSSNCKSQDVFEGLRSM